MQIISIATSRLFEQVQQGMFSEPLYYRLNIVLIEIALASLDRS